MPRKISNKLKYTNPIFPTVNPLMIRKMEIGYKTYNLFFLKAIVQNGRKKTKGYCIALILNFGRKMIVIIKKRKPKK